MPRAVVNGATHVVEGHGKIPREAGDERVGIAEGHPLKAVKTGPAKALAIANRSLALAFVEVIS
jgi:hypothetical protein